MLSFYMNISFYMILGLCGSGIFLSID